ncbi:FAD-binding protein [Pedobacter sp. KACC 23697]|uniref:FAD-binding protein n=1 Tax=Pedobacter sp. KACC 23697 TaxID=3149230 RepID=A0AAU7KC30_9SPHI
MSLQKIGMITLENSGAFVARIQISYQIGIGPKKMSIQTGNINGLTSKTVDPEQLGVPDGATVQLYVYVMWGKDVEAPQIFQYQKGNGLNVRYHVSNVAWDPVLVLLPWHNWSRNIVYHAPANTETYYYPKNRTDLQAILQSASAAGVQVRVSGQRHSQPPLVTDDNRNGNTSSKISWLIDMSCYADLGPAGSQNIMMEPSGQKVTLNTGVREDELDAFLTSNNKMLITATAGGFFSLGGMTSVDVHGATTAAPIFSETTSAFNIMAADGSMTTINSDTPAINGWQPIQFARVSMGALGIVTSVTIDVMDRPWATTIKPERETFVVSDQHSFVTKFKGLVAQHTRMETFYNPYSSKYLSLRWDIDSNPVTKTPNISSTVPNACEMAKSDEYGAPLEGIAEPFGQAAGLLAQVSGSTFAATVVMDLAYGEIEKLFDAAAAKYSDLWLSKAARVMFMSYFFELPDLSDAGMQLVWKGLNVVTDRLKKSNDFLVVAPLEFRFIKGGNTALAGTYTDNPDSTFVNLDLIAFIEPTVASSYPAPMLQFFADIEREWVAMGGITHNGKMFGFYDPAAAAGSYSAPFNTGFLKELAKRRNQQNGRVDAFEYFRAKQDPNNLFLNDYVRAMLG